jgi:Flp pilus assembly protein TadD
MLREALQQEPENFEVLANLGRVSLQNDQPIDAETYLRKALKIKSGDTTLAVNLGKALQRQGRHSEAEELFLDTLADDPANVELLFSLGVIAADQRGDTILARDYFLQALKSEPENPEIQKRLSKLDTEA